MSNELKTANKIMDEMTNNNTQRAFHMMDTVPGQRNALITTKDSWKKSNNNDGTSDLNSVKL